MTPSRGAAPGKQGSKGSGKGSAGPGCLWASRSPYLWADIQVRKKTPMPLGQYSLYLQPGRKAPRMHLLRSRKLNPPFSDGKGCRGADVQLEWGGVTSQGWWQQCQRVMLLSGYRKLVEETPRPYLLEEARVGGLKRSCAHQDRL